MTLRHFRIFQCVCSTGSITSAAEKLNMTQPAVSIAISELESFYDTKLFERMNRRIYITGTGKTLLQYAGTILSQYEESIEVIRDDRLFMKCRLGVNVTIGETILSDTVQKIRAVIPASDLKIHIDNTSHISKMLTENTIDMAMMDQPLPLPGFESIPAYTGSMGIIRGIRPGMPTALTLEEFEASPLLLREEGSSSREIVDAVIKSRSLNCSPAVESTSTLALLDMAEKGFGLAVIPDDIIEREAGKRRIERVSVAGLSFERSYYLVYHSRKYLTSAMKSVISVISADLQQ